MGGIAGFGWGAARSLRLVILGATTAFLLTAQPPSFSQKIYPILEKAGCRNCHNVEGVASATRLHFPAEDAAKPRDRGLRQVPGRIRRPAESRKFHALVEADSAYSTYRRRAHSENQRRGSALKSWIALPGELSGPELARPAVPAGRGRRTWRRADGGSSPADAQPVQQYGSRPAERYTAVPPASSHPKITSTASRTNTRRFQSRRF